MIRRNLWLRVRWLGTPTAHAFPIRGFVRPKIMCYALCEGEEAPEGLRVRIDSTALRCPRCRWLLER